MVHLLQGGKLIFLAGNLKGSFNGLQHAHFLAGHENDGIPFTAGSSGTPDAVGVGFQVEGSVEIQNVGNAVHVEPAGGDVGGHKNADFTTFQAVYGFFSQTLRHIAIEGFCGIAFALKHLGDFHGRILGAGKNQHGFEFFDFQKTQDHLPFLMLANLNEPLSDIG